MYTWKAEVVKLCLICTGRGGFIRPMRDELDAKEYRLQQLEVMPMAKEKGLRDP